MSGLWPDRMLFKHDYRVQRQITFVATGALLDQYFRGNGLYDPDPNLVNGYPYWFQTLNRVYSQYYVSASKIDVWFNTSAFTITGSATPGTQNNTPPTASMFFIVPRLSTSTVGTNPMDIMQATNCRYKRFSLGMNPRNVRVSNFMRTDKICGHPTRGDSTYYGDGAHNPSTMWHWWVGARNLNGISATLQVQAIIDVKITLYALWTNKYMIVNPSSTVSETPGPVNAEDVPYDWVPPDEEE